MLATFGVGPTVVRATIDGILRRNVAETAQLYDASAVFDLVPLCVQLVCDENIAAVASIGSRQTECEALSDESASQVPLPELVGDRHFARFPHSIRTEMVPWLERQPQVRAQRKPTHSQIYRRILHFLII